MSFCYSLISCNPEVYPSIVDLCTETRHPYEGKVVYIDQFYNGQPVDYLRTYTLTYGGENTCVCQGWLPTLGLNFENSCSSAYEFATYKNCQTNQLQAFAFPLPTGIGGTVVFRQDGQCDCWEYFSEDITTPPVLVGSFTAYASCEECTLSLGASVCATGERSISYASRVKLLNPIAPDRGFKECCYDNLVLADINSSDSYKNDFNGFYFQRNLQNTTVDFILMRLDDTTEYSLNDDTYGAFQDFGGANTNLTYYIVEWKKVLTLLGEGSYQIRKEVTISGIPTDVFSNTFNLKQFSIENADKTVRLDCEQDGFLVNLDIDFKGTGFRTGLRMRGFFGRPERAYEKDYLFKNTYESEQITMSVRREYLFQGLNLPECIATELLDFIVLGNKVFASDYNKNNHSYTYDRLKVELVDNDNTEYNTLKRELNTNLVFTDRFNNYRKINK